MGREGIRVNRIVNWDCGSFFEWSKKSRALNGRKWDSRGSGDYRVQVSCGKVKSFEFS